MQELKVQTVYIPVDVKERLPELNAKYFATVNGIRIHVWFIDGKWETNDKVQVIVDYWLERQDNMVVMSREELVGIVADAFHAGRENVCLPVTHPDKEKYISQIFKP